MGQGYTYIGNRATKLDVSQSMLPVGRIILTDDSGNGYSAQVANFSESTHSTLTKDDEFASQARANAILQELQGYVYKPYQATDAVVDPLAEAGDSVQVGDVYGYVDGLDYTCDALGTSDIGASNNSEEHSESQYESVDTLKQKRMSKRVDSVEAASGEATAAIQVLSNAITLEAQTRENADTTMSGQLTVNANKIALVVEETGGGNYAIKSASIVTAINDSGSSVVIDADKVNLNGYLTITAGDSRYDASGSATAVKNGLATAGYTTVNGGNIHSGVITLGGANNGNGKLRIVNANDVEIGIWDRSGIHIKDNANLTGTTFDPRFKVTNKEDTAFGCFIGCGQFQNILHPGQYPDEQIPYIYLEGHRASGTGNGEFFLNPIETSQILNSPIIFGGSDIMLTSSEIRNESGTERLGIDDTGMYYQRNNGTKKYLKDM